MQKPFEFFFVKLYI